MEVVAGLKDYRQPFDDGQPRLAALIALQRASLASIS
jgi:hypothetical protein